MAAEQTLQLLNRYMFGKRMCIHRTPAVAIVVDLFAIQVLRSLGGVIVLCRYGCLTDAAAVLRQQQEATVRLMHMWKLPDADRRVKLAIRYVKRVLHGNLSQALERLIAPRANIVDGSHAVHCCASGTHVDPVERVVLTLFEQSGVRANYDDIYAPLSEFVHTGPVSLRSLVRESNPNVVGKQRASSAALLDQASRYALGTSLIWNCVFQGIPWGDLEDLAESFDQKEGVERPLANALRSDDAALPVANRSEVGANILDECDVVLRFASTVWRMLWHLSLYAKPGSAETSHVMLATRRLVTQVLGSLRGVVILCIHGHSHAARVPLRRLREACVQLSYTQEHTAELGHDVRLARSQTLNRAYDEYFHAVRGFDRTIAIGCLKNIRKARRQWKPQDEASWPMLAELNQAVHGNPEAFTLEAGARSVSVGSMGDLTRTIWNSAVLALAAVHVCRNLLGKTEATAAAKLLHQHNNLRDLWADRVVDARSGVASPDIGPDAENEVERLSTTLKFLYEVQMPRVWLEANERQELSVRSDSWTPELLKQLLPEIAVWYVERPTFESVGYSSQPVDFADPQRQHRYAALDQRKLRAETRRLAFIHRAFVRELLNSTQESAIALAHCGEPVGTVVIADAQDSPSYGWESPAGVNLYWSLIVPDRETVQKDVAKIVRRTVRASFGFETVINPDSCLMVRERALGGVIAYRGVRHGVAVVGVGLNLNASTDDYQHPRRYTSVFMETGQLTQREVFIIKLLDAVGHGLW